MIPPTILHNLARLRRRERLLAFAWGAAQWFAVVVAALFVACLIDWFIDRDRDTPVEVRRGLLAVQVLLAAAAGFLFLIKPQLRRLPVDSLALWVEAHQPRFAHRLITAVQLARPDAHAEGMSQELIAIVTREAETQSTAIDFAAVADHRRLHLAGFTLLPVLVLIALPFVLFPSLAGVLLARQFQADIDIPHSVSIEPLKLDQVRPAGETTVLEFRVRSDDLDPAWVGEVFVTPEGQPRDRYPLEFSRRDGLDAIFQATPAVSSVSFTYTARIYDGRMRRPGHVKMVPRPVVTDQLAWVQLPEFCGVRPDKSRYEQPQGRGDIVGIPGSSARVFITMQKPVRKAFLEIVGPQATKPAKDDEPASETVKRIVPMALNAKGITAEAIFDLRPDETAYRIHAIDEYDFSNIPAPRRGLRLAPEEPPQVALLKEQMPPAGPIASGSWEDFVVDGLPIVPGKKIRLAYVAQGPFGLGRANFLYRVLHKTESGDDQPKDEPWRVLPLPEINASEKSGAFDPRRGAFEHSPLDQTIYFHAVPSPNPDVQLGRTLGGGRFDFETKGIPDGKGGLQTLRVGDQLEFCVEIFADKDPASKRPSARSEIRTRPIISEEELIRWISEAYQEGERLKDLDKKQRGVFELR